MNHLAYTALFRTIAQKSKLIGNNTTTHFIRMIRSGGPFPTLDIKEFLDKQGTTLQYPALLLESYDAGYKDNLSDNVQKVPECGFIILDKGKRDNQDVIDGVLDATEAIGEHVISYLRNYFAERGKLFNLNAASLERIDIPTKELYGTRFNFHLPEVANTALYFNSNDWHA